MLLQKDNSHTKKSREPDCPHVYQNFQICRPCDYFEWVGGDDCFNLSNIQPNCAYNRVHAKKEEVIDELT